MSSQADIEYQDQVNHALFELFIRQSQPEPLSRSGFMRVMQRPEQHQIMNGILKRLAGKPRSAFTYEEWRLSEPYMLRGLTQGSELGAATLTEAVGQEMLDSMTTQGASSRFRHDITGAGQTKTVIASEKSDAMWYPPATQGTAITADASISGTSVSGDVCMLGSLAEVSNESIDDGRTVFAAAILETLSRGAIYRKDFTCIRSDGTADTNDGSMVGIFAHPNVPIVNAAAGNVTVAQTEPDDWTNHIAGADSDAINRESAFIIHPSFWSPLAKIRDGGERLLKPPTEPGGDWTILGWPVIWSSVAPNTNSAGQPIAAWGRLDAYHVVLRSDFEIQRSVSRKFNQNLSLFRLVARMRCEMLDAASWSILKLAAA